MASLTPPPLLDPVALLTTALSAPESEQRGHLQRAKAVLELQPGQIQTIVGYILPFSTAPGLISDWMVELVELAICRSNLSVDVKTQLGVQSLDTLANLLPTAQLKTSKILIQIFSSLYPLVFRYLWTNRSDAQLWTTLSKVKQRILGWATLGTGDDGRPIKKGQRVQAIKFLQKAVLVQTKGPNDPRLRVAGTDPNLSQCPSDHPFLSVSELEAEGNKLLEFILLALYTSTDVDVLTSVVNTLPVIIKLRPALSVVFIPALTGWTPEPINGLSRGDIRSVEKVVKVTMSYLEKSPFATAHKAVLQSALGIQSARMEAAYKLALEESRVQIQKRKLDETAAAASSLQQTSRAKRPRWDVPGSSSTPPPPPTLPVQAGPSSGYPPFPPVGRGGPPFPPPGMPPPTLHQPGMPPPSAHLSYQQHLPPPPQQQASSIYNVSQLPIELVIDLLVANLSAVSQQALTDAVRDVRRSLFPDAPQQPPPLTSFLLKDAVLPPGGGGGPGLGRGGVNANGELKREEDEMDLDSDAVNPMDMVGADEEEEEEEKEVSAEELERLMVNNKKRKQPNSQPDDDDLPLPSSSKLHPLADSTPNPAAIPKFLQFQLSNFALPPPATLSSSARQALALKALKRIWEAGSHLSSSSNPNSTGEGEEEIQSSAPGRELWMMLGARLVTRAGLVGVEGVKVEGSGGKEEEEREEERRRVVCQFVAEDFGARYKFATLWLNEEWYNDSQLSPEDERRSPLYRTSLLLLINLYLPRLSGTYLSRFVLDLPDIPLELLATLQTLCTDPDRSRGRVGLKTLRDLVVERPPLRDEALRNLLELCTHPDAGTRNPAIATVRAWVPDNKPWSSTIRTFALQVLRRLQAGDAREKEQGSGGGGEMEGVEGGEKLPEEEVEEADQIAQSQYLPLTLEMPIEQEVVRQHVELMFALTKKIPEFLDEIFAAYGTLSPSIQEAFQQILTPLIKSLGPNHGKLLTLLRTFPPGADSLALRTLQILSEPKDPETPRVKLSVPLVALVKSLVAERDLDPRFILPILPELDKSEVKKHLPRIVSLLNGKAPERELVRQVIFQLVDSPDSVLPPNTPRMLLGQRFTPAELLVLLHRFEKEGGLKPTMEAIDICFSITEVYKSEVLGVVLQQISDEPELPTLFLRTVIKSVQTYKSLTPFVATNLLSRLITKKIWTSPQLWEGFIRVAKMLSTSSYPALLQLPRDQLKEIVGREDGKGVKAGLREFVLKKAGGNATRLPAWFAEVFGDQVLPTVGSESPGPTPDPLLAFAGLPGGGGDSPLSSAPTTPGVGTGGEANGATEMVM